MYGAYSDPGVALQSLPQDRGEPSDPVPLPSVVGRERNQPVRMSSAWHRDRVGRRCVQALVHTLPQRLSSRRWLAFGDPSDPGEGLPPRSLAFQPHPAAGQHEDVARPDRCRTPAVKIGSGIVGDVGLAAAGRTIR